LGRRRRAEGKSALAPAPLLVWAFVVTPEQHNQQPGQTRTEELSGGRTTEGAHRRPRL
jgi:hypothetical protein